MMKKTLFAAAATCAIAMSGTASSATKVHCNYTIGGIHDLLQVTDRHRLSLRVKSWDGLFNGAKILTLCDFDLASDGTSTSALDPEECEHVRKTATLAQFMESRLRVTFNGLEVINQATGNKDFAADDPAVCSEFQSWALHGDAIVEFELFAP